MFESLDDYENHVIKLFQLICDGKAPRTPKDMNLDFNSFRILVNECMKNGWIEGYLPNQSGFNFTANLCVTLRGFQYWDSILSAKQLAIAQKANKKSIISLVLSAFAVITAIFALLSNVTSVLEFLIEHSLLP